MSSEVEVRPSPILDARGLFGVSSLREIPWEDPSAAFRDWLVQHPTEMPKPLASSREAEISILHHRSKPVFVIKQWKVGQRVNARQQHDLLRSALESRLPVPVPAAWASLPLYDSVPKRFEGLAALGRDDGLQLLVTGYAGEPLPHPTCPQIREAARLLTAIHNTRPLPALCPSRSGPNTGSPLQPTVSASGSSFSREIGWPVPGPSLRSRPDQALASWHLAGMDEHPDLMHVLHRIKPPRRGPLSIAHGDFHPGNLLLLDGRMTVADWSDASIGDTRYDLAWASLLLWVYQGEIAYSEFLDAYRDAGGTTADSGVFETIAALRWILLARTAPVPINQEWWASVRSFLQDRLGAQVADSIAYERTQSPEKRGRHMEEI